MGYEASDANYVIPEGHETFISEFKALLGRIPSSAERFGLADLGEDHDRSREYTTKCHREGPFTVCELVERPK